jgi:hypothetical protein
MSMMFYWLGGFTQCLLPFTSCIIGRPDTVNRLACRVWARVVGVGSSGPVPGRPFGHLYVEVWFGTWSLVAWRGRACNELV